MAGRGDTEDLATLAKLDETILLGELSCRYVQDKIYTYVGDILVAVNPFKQLQIYGREQRQQYKNAPRAQNPPHVFAISDATYHQMLTRGENQCCVISGESGAGKTESAKLIVTELVELSHGKSILEQKILQVNPLLEAFGNAMTLMNDNSSRFGKYLQLKFKDGHVTGAKINEYLLEKSRVVYQNSGEQNFHIFYCMFAGLDETLKERLHLRSPDEFYYMCEGASCLRNRHKEKQQQFEEVRNALDLVGFETEFHEHIFTCLAAILHLGNVTFTEDDDEYSHIEDPQTGPLKIVSDLTGIDHNLLGDVMTVSVSVTRGEVIRKHLNKQKAEAARDALSKALYDRVFRWIVNRINQLLAPTAEEMIGESEIGILDIFGFEKFDRNSFEQLCINLANEQLQFFFNEHIFTLEKEEYKREGISMSTIKFQDNKPLLDLFLTKPVGLLALLDEQCSFPKATDETFVTKLNQTFKKRKPHFIASKDTVSGTFSIQHYAGKVEYDSWGFLEKNRDSLPDGAMELLRTSSNELIKLLFMASITRTGTLAVGRLTSRRTGKLKKRTLAKGTKKGGGPATKAPTVGAQFKNSLQVLIEKMNAATPHFIRCIKPNTMKVPNSFDSEYVSAQLRYTGMLETTRIRKEGFAFRPTFEEFIETYKIIAASPQMSVSTANCRKVLKCAKLADFQIGKTKVFLKYWHVDKLNELLGTVHHAATTIEKVVRGFIQRQKYRVLLAAKREQEKHVSTFLSQLPQRGNELYAIQKSFNAQDEARPKDELAPEVEDSSLQTQAQVVDLTPPDDVAVPPPEPKISDSDAEDEEDDVFNPDDGDTFVAPARNTRFKKFGQEGTRNASVRWFKATQVDRVRSSSGNFHEWFHGIITRRRAEQLLTNKPNGTFVIRVSESRFGYSLSFRVTGRCKHYMITQLETGKYVIVGEPRVHSSLEDLVRFHQTHAVNVDGDLLTLPCGQSQSENLDYGDLLDSHNASASLTSPPPVPPRTTSGSGPEFRQMFAPKGATRSTGRRGGATRSRVLSSSTPGLPTHQEHNGLMMAPPLPPRKR